MIALFIIGAMLSMLGIYLAIVTGISEENPLNKRFRFCEISFYVGLLLIFIGLFIYLSRIV